MSPTRTLRTVLITALACLAIGLVAYFGLGRRTSETVVVVDDADDSVARVVALTFHNASALKVGTLRGSVRTQVSDPKWISLFSSRMVMKAPFTVDYFVDMSHLARRDLDWDPKTRTLTVDIPPVVAAAPNVDAAHMELATTGVFVTRNAFAQMARGNAGKARQVAAQTAQRPEWIALVRERARAEVARLLAVPLEVSGARVDTVRVRFPDERGGPGPGKQMERSRSLDEVFGLAR